jgi:hypothetical protein
MTPVFQEPLNFSDLFTGKSTAAYNGAVLSISLLTNLCV